MQEWIALVQGNGDVSIVSTLSERLAVLLKRFEWAVCFWLGEHETSNAAYEAYAGDEKEEMSGEELENLASQIAPVSGVIV